jgi:hypothetical protein
MAVKTHGARVYFYDDGVVLVKQTRKGPKTGRYIIDTLSDGTQRERHVDPGDDLALGEAPLPAV